MRLQVYLPPRRRDTTLRGIERDIEPGKNGRILGFFANHPLPGIQNGLDIRGLARATMDHGNDGTAVPRWRRIDPRLGL